MPPFKKACLSRRAYHFQEKCHVSILHALLSAVTMHASGCHSLDIGMHTCNVKEPWTRFLHPTSLLSHPAAGTGSTQPEEVLPVRSPRRPPTQAPKSLKGLLAEAVATPLPDSPEQHRGGCGHCGDGGCASSSMDLKRIMPRTARVVPCVVDMVLPYNGRKCCKAMLLPAVLQRVHALPHHLCVHDRDWPPSILHLTLHTGQMMGGSDCNLHSCDWQHLDRHTCQPVHSRSLQANKNGHNVSSKQRQLRDDEFKAFMLPVHIEC